MPFFGSMPQADILGLPSATGAVLSVGSALLAGPLVGAIVALVGGVLLVTFVVDLTLGSGLSVALWTASSVGAGLMAERLRRIQRERAAVHEVGRRARQESERARGRLARLQRVTAALSQALSSEDAVAAVAGEAVEAMGATGAAIGLVDGAGTSLDITIALAGQEAPRRRTRAPLDSSISLCEAFNTGRAIDVSGSEWLERFPDGFWMLGHLGTTLMVRPLVAGADRLGAIGLAFDDRRELAPEDIELFDAIAGQVGLAVRRVQTFESETQIAATLQDSLLPTKLPTIPGVDLWACYIAGADGLEIGGDWYDVVALDDGSVCLAVGDVCGHGLEAAAAMGQLRSAWRALASDEGATPASVLTSLDRFADDMPGVPFSTVAVVRLDPANGNLDYGCAGHPPPLVLAPNGEAHYLPGGRSMPLGVPWQGERHEHGVRLEAGSTILLYSDGLIERRGEPIDRGMQRLRDVAAARSRIADLEPLGKELAKLSLANQEDDITLLMVRLASFPLRFSRVLSSDPQELAGFRRDLGAWLQSRGVGHAVCDDVVLACSEAVSNAIEHGYVGTSGDVEVSVSVGMDGTIDARVQDHGTWRTEGSDPLRGRGLGLIRSLMDSVDISMGVNGTTLSMHLGEGQSVSTNH
jgi:serine phosphatase RsbU (regulator of sigma subunit)/anti-sigma regulatory factor (Ser/Thr protein kinase)